MDKTAQKKQDTGNSEKEVNDIYRDTPLRYFAYAGHLAWFCRPYIPFNLASMASVAYVCADAFDKTAASAARGEPETKVLITAVDAFLWHFLASFAIPGLMLHGINCVTCSFRSQRSKCRPRSRFFLLPCLLSGLAIPLIARPIDIAIDSFMNNSVRKKMEDILCGVGDCEPKEDCKEDMKFKWFFDQSRDQNLLDLERHRQKMRDQQQKGNEDSMGRGGDGYGQGSDAPEGATPEPVSAQEQDLTDADNENLDNQENQDNQDNENNEKAVQVDRETRPPRPERGPPLPPPE